MTSKITALPIHGPALSLKYSNPSENHAAPRLAGTTFTFTITNPLLFDSDSILLKEYH